jgi:hypothetical protein
MWGSGPVHESIQQVCNGIAIPQDIGGAQHAQLAQQSRPAGVTYADDVGMIVDRNRVGLVPGPTLGAAIPDGQIRAVDGIELLPAAGPGVAPLPDVGIAVAAKADCKGQIGRLAKRQIDLPEAPAADPGARTQVPLGRYDGGRDPSPLGAELGEGTFEALAGAPPAGGPLGGAPFPGEPEVGAGVLPGPGSWVRSVPPSVEGPVESLHAVARSIAVRTGTRARATFEFAADMRHLPGEFSGHWAIPRPHATGRPSTVRQ